MSSRRKQSKPIGFTVEGAVSTTPNVVQGAEDDASSRSSHTESTSSDQSTNTQDSGKKADANSQDTDGAASCTELAANTKEVDNPNEVRVGDKLPEVEDSVSQMKNGVVGGEDQASAFSEQQQQGVVVDVEMDKFAENSGESDDTIEPGEVVKVGKRKRLSEEEEMGAENEDMFDDYSNNVEDLNEDDDYDEDEVDGMFDENSMNGSYSMNEDYPEHSSQGYYAHGNKRIMMGKHGSGANLNDQYPVLYNAMHTDAGEYGRLQKGGDVERTLAGSRDGDEESGLLAYKCKVCGKGFKHRRSLNRHVKLHSGEKNFHCPYCSTAFARSDHLKAHIRTHNNSKPFRCSVCQCGYSTQAALKVHIAHHHSKSKFKCVLCNDLEFHSQLALEGHIYKNHSKENGFEMADDNGELGATRRRTALTYPGHAHEDSAYDNVQFNNSFNRVHMADMNNCQGENSPEYFEESGGGYGEEDVDSGHAQAAVDGDYGGHGEEGDEDIRIECASDNEGKNDHSDDNEGSQLSVAFEECHKSQSGAKEAVSPASQRQPAADENGVKTTRPETATFIDTYGEDDDEQHNKSSTDSSIGNGSHTEEACSSAAKTAEARAAETDDEDDVIIEESLSTAEAKRADMHPVLKMALRAGQTPQNSGVPRVAAAAALKPPTLVAAPNLSASRLESSVRVSQPLQRSGHLALSNDNYCEMCNARFSNGESFTAHMRVVHQIVTQSAGKTSFQSGMSEAHYQQQQQQQTKMPYLSNLLNKSGEMVKKPLSNSNHITPVINNKQESQKGPNSMLIHGCKTSCTIPNCNCSPSSSAGGHFLDQHHGPDTLDPYSAKETHYTCGQCSLTLLKISDFIGHIKQEHCVEVFRCILCKQMQLFDNLNLLREHFFQVHQSIRTEYYRCRFCPLNSSSLGSTLFLSPDELNIHIEQTHQHQQQQQHQHTSLTPTHTSRNIHMRMPSARESNYPSLSSAMAPPAASIYPSAQSGPFPPKPSPYPYTRSAAGSFPSASPGFSSKCFKCPYCDSDFSQQSYLNQHIQIAHNGSLKATMSADKPTPSSVGHNHQPLGNNRVSDYPSVGSTSFPCQYCRNTFTTRQQLERHVRIHISSIDLKCNICDKHFPTHDALSQHKLSHCKTLNTSDATSLKASDHAALSLTSSLTSPSHLSTSQPAVCVYCKQTIEDEGQFKEHFKTHNNIGQNTVSGKANSFICICCRQTLTSNNEYNIHMRHHLKRNGTTTTTAALTAANGSSNEQLPISADLQTGEESAVSSRKRNSTEAVASGADTSAKASSSSSSKLKCSKCELKFEEWQELADHIAKDHAAARGADSGTAKGAEAAAAEGSAAKVSKAISSAVEQASATPVVKAEKVDSPAAFAANVAHEAAHVIGNPVSNSSSPRSINSGSNTSSSTSSLNTSASQSTHRDASLSTHINSELCEICSSKFDSIHKLQAHLLTKHEFGNTNASVYTCPVCDESYSRPESLLEHANIHGHAARIYKCSQCSLAFVFKSQLINHSFSHRNQPALPPRPKLHQPIYQKMPHHLPHQQHPHGMQQQQHHHHHHQPMHPISQPQQPIRHPMQGHLVRREIPSHLLASQQQGPMVGQPPYGGPPAAHVNPMNPHHDKIRQIQMNSGPQGFRCDECNAMFDSFRNYQMHNQSFHGRTIILNGHGGPGNNTNPGAPNFHQRTNNLNINRMNDMYNKTNSSVF